jgi:hypothetical protein
MSGWNLRNDINTELIKTWDDFNYTCFIALTKTSQWNKRLGARFLVHNFIWQPQVQEIFLDTFTKLQRVTISFAISLCVSACTTASNPLPIRPHGTTLFMKTDIWAFYENLQRKFKFHENMTIITGTLHEGLRTFVTISQWNLLRMRNVSDKGCWDNIFPKIMLFSYSCHFLNFILTYMWCLEMGIHSTPLCDSVMCIEMKYSCWNFNKHIILMDNISEDD